MRAQRIKRGFHRIGIVAALAFLLPPVVVFGAIGLLGARPAIEAINLAWLSLVLAALAYPVARAVAWVIASFVADKTSN